MDSIVGKDTRDEISSLVNGIVLNFAMKMSFDNVSDYLVIVPLTTNPDPWYSEEPKQELKEYVIAVLDGMPKCTQERVFSKGMHGAGLETLAELHRPLPAQLIRFNAELPPPRLFLWE